MYESEFISKLNLETVTKIEIDLLFPGIKLTIISVRISLSSSPQLCF